ncbi:hypothetical protein [Lysobacter solisilvae (ex Woo and Kim 2020)]|uniref:Uncharacterized protein n=1 Tax=Agrilutibacter terrestris TaxID=2865112 RepID=A0A7H0FX98_9GAMM|nr:hypothetical protein [Lysobacter terrestris]QNP40664.1 hypothetical protein H8B22_14580 [Lysobacter terrestris]
MINQGECPKCGKRLLHVRIESVFGQNNDSDDIRCLSYSCIHCNMVLNVQLDPRAKPRRRTASAAAVVERVV